MKAASQPLPDPTTLTSAERIAHINSMRARMLSDNPLEQPSTEELRWFTSVLRTERAVDAKSRKSSRAAPATAAPVQPVNVMDL